MKKIFYSILIVFIFCNVSYAAAQHLGTSESVAPENAPALKEYYRIKIINTENGTIEVSRDMGKTWKKVGKVLLPTNKLSNKGYTASRWINVGDVAAVAVNAIHIKVDYNFSDDRGVIFSILPNDSYKPPIKQNESVNSYLSPTSSIYTDIKGGTEIFGGDYAPMVGNRIGTMSATGWYYKITKDYVPKVGHELVIIVERPVRYPKEIIFENRFGGLITIIYNDGEERFIGQVLRPVEGVGRFIGTQMADVGRIRAVHPGVIDISTSPLDQIGGFQIIPAAHGMSKEMKTARTLTQWMVIGPVKATDPSYEGIAPFFKYYIQPRYIEDDIEKDNWEDKLLERFLVQIKHKDDPEWKLMPVYYFDKDLSKPLPRWAYTAMEGISHIRIMFPLYRKF